MPLALAALIELYKGGCSSFMAISSKCANFYIKQVFHADIDHLYKIDGSTALVDLNAPTGDAVIVEIDIDEGKVRSSHCNHVCTYMYTYACTH